MISPTILRFCYFLQYKERLKTDWGKKNKVWFVGRRERDSKKAERDAAPVERAVVTSVDGREHELWASCLDNGMDGLDDDGSKVWRFLFRRQKEESVSHDNLCSPPFHRLSQPQMPSNATSRQQSVWCGDARHCYSGKPTYWSIGNGMAAGPLLEFVLESDRENAFFSY